MDVIKTGTILIENGTLLPGSLVLAGEPYSKGWTTPGNRRSDFERDIHRAGWTFFFAETAVHTAVHRLIGNANAQHGNCLEVGQITMKSLFGLPFASVSAHSRHIQWKSVFAG